MNYTSKDKQFHQSRQEQARRVEYENCVKAPRPETFSARMQVYCYTELCPVVGLRRLLVKRGVDGCWISQ